MLWFLMNTASLKIEEKNIVNSLNPVLLRKSRLQSHVNCELSVDSNNQT